MLKLEPRPQASRWWSYGSPVLALAITVLLGVVLFMALGKDPVRALLVFFWEPIKTPYAIGELMVKTTPLLLIALGLAVCFRSNVWNIGAEGQFVIGAVTAGGVALLADKTTGAWIDRREPSGEPVLTTARRIRARLPADSNGEEAARRFGWLDASAAARG